MKHDKPIFASLALSAILFGVTLFVIRTAKADPVWAAETMRPWAVAIVNRMADFWSFIPWSVAEMGLFALIIAFIVTVTLTLIRFFSRPGKLRTLLTFAASWVLIASILFSVFELLFGYGYHAESMTKSLNLQSKPRPAEELYAAVLHLAERANQTYPGGTDTVPDREEFQALAEAVTPLAEAYFGTPQASPKMVRASELMSYTQITGVFTPFTGESNVNTNDVGASLPFTMAHELCHRNGVNPEDEANLFAFILLYESDTPRLQYSASFKGLLYTMPKLRKADVDLYQQASAAISREVWNDISAYGTHWDQYEGKTAEVASNMNHSYLQSHGQTEGVKSYGNVVDWILAYFENQL